MAVSAAARANGLPAQRDRGGSGETVLALGALGALGIGAVLLLNRKTTGIGGTAIPAGHAAMIAEFTVSVDGPAVGGPPGTLVLQASPWFVSSAISPLAAPGSADFTRLVGLSDWAYLYHYPGGPVAHCNVQLVGPTLDGSYFAMVSKFAIAEVKVAFKGTPIADLPAQTFLHSGFGLIGGAPDYPFFHLQP